MFPSDWGIIDEEEAPRIFEPHKTLDDLLADCSSPKKKKTPLTEEKKSSKKCVHRDVEKQRRQHMAGLYASLRSLLPLEYLKGKRAISDHMHQAVAYIKDMQKNIDEMKRQRDGLSAANAAVEARNVSCTVKVNLNRDGAEILIRRILNQESFPLSHVLAYLSGKGLHVISCVSTTSQQHQSSLHKLQIQVDESTSIDPSELQDKLVNLVKLP